MYRQLAVLLPSAPVPLVTVLQLWGITDPQEAQETVQIFVMQVGVLVAVKPFGAAALWSGPVLCVDDCGWRDHVLKPQPMQQLKAVLCRLGCAAGCVEGGYVA